MGEAPLRFRVCQECLARLTAFLVCQPCTQFRIAQNIAHYKRLYGWSDADVREKLTGRSTPSILAGTHKPHT